jgi:hypothetical protein
MINRTTFSRGANGNKIVITLDIKSATANTILEPNLSDNQPPF